ncbi:hypothetical protein BGW80DRAFT_1159508, partial [Lactifluus volemus]
AQLQENYARDPALVKKRVLASQERPRFPGSLWSDVIANTYVDLNRLFDFHFATDGPSKHSVQHFGDIDITTTNIRPTREIHSSGDWRCAWDRYQEAVVFLYPHQARELTAYAKHIVDTFIAVGPLVDRVIEYDKRVRTYLAESVGVLLSDTIEFHSIYTQFVNCPFATKEITRTQGPAKSTRGRPSEPCKRFNLGSCPDGTKCRFQHVCLRCSKRGHSSLSC